MKESIYDLIIIGGGAAGVSSAVFAKKTGMKTLLIEKNKIGQGLKYMGDITSYPGIIKIEGEKLAKIFEDQVKNLGIDVVFDEVYDTVLTEKIKEVKCTKKTYKSKTIIIATGTSVKNLDLKNEIDFVGRGLSYSANLDREKYENKIVAVFGGGTTALISALYLSEKVKEVYVISRREGFMGDKHLYEKLKTVHNIKFILSTKVNELCGNNELTSIVVENILTKKQKEIKIDCLFVAMGRGTDTDFISGINKTQDGFIATDSKMQTSIGGVFAAGDIRNTELRDIVSAVSDGAIATINAYGYISKMEGKSYD